MTARIIEAASARPRFEYDRATVKSHLTRWLQDHGGAGLGYLSTIDTNLVDRRSLVIPIDEVFARRSFAEKNDAYIRAAVEMGEEAVLACLEKAGVGPGAVDHVISTSCTGFTIPSLDALLAHKLGMKRTLSRLPITEHGCAAGAVALAQAASHLRAYPRHTVLVLAVELASLTFQYDDVSPENVVAAGLFADGAAAALLTSEPRAGRPQIVGAESCLFPESADLMGFRLTDTGFKLILSREVPAAIRAHAVPALATFLDRQGLSPALVNHWILHPGGRKIIEAFEDAFDLGPGGLEHSRAVLRTRGNLSSATVLCMLDDFFDRGLAQPGDVGLLVAFGPGFGAEMLLLSW
jgi:alkylresorcinol/alkylpyrone synthase